MSQPLIPSRFWSKVTGGDYTTCWIWTAHKSSDGYGTFWANGTTVRAHRWAYESLVGPIPEGLVLDHLCRNPACVNPWHLDPVTQMINFWRGNTVAHRTHCPHGHPYSEANTFCRRGRRECRTCMREQSRRYKMTHRQQLGLDPVAA